MEGEANHFGEGVAATADARRCPGRPFGRPGTLVERYDLDALVGLLREDVAFSMPPFALWLRGPESVRAWLLGRGAKCCGSRLLPTAACGSPAFGHYHPGPDGRHLPWALVVLETAGGRIAGWHSFLDTETLFPAFGLPDHL